jgi:uncharacterized membrane protein
MLSMSPWSFGFRRGLARVLPEWVDEGLLSEEAAEAIRERHALDAQVGADAATLTVYLFGALLVFGGLASFVAWNWAALPAAIKLVGGLVLMVGVEALGYGLGWVRKRSPSLGHALVVLGVLAFGANLALVAQIFHIEPTGTGLLAWSVTAAVFAWALRSAPLAAIASLLGFAWLGYHAEALPGGLVLPHLAWLAALLWARALRSVGLSAVAVVGGGALVGVVAQTGAGLGWAALHYVPLAFSVAGLGLGRSRRGAWLAHAAGGLVVVYAFVLGFSDAGEAAADAAGSEKLLGALFASLPPIVVGVGAALRASDRDERPTTLFALGASVLLVLAPFAGAVATWLVAHACLVGKVAWDLHRSLAELERGPFWTAVVLGTATIAARFLEIQSGLLAKAVAFVTAGVAVIVAGYLFERRRQEAGRARSGSDIEVTHA